MKKVLYILILVMLFPGCSSIDMHLDTKALKKPDKILIGYFENRILKFDPYIADNFRDNLQFEFYKKGYIAELLEVKSDQDTLKNDSPLEKIDTGIAHYMKTSNADLFVQGIITVREIGEFTDVKTSSSIMILLHNNQGTKIGELLYITSKSVADAATLKNIAGSLVLKLHNGFPR